MSNVSIKVLRMGVLSFALVACGVGSKDGSDDADSGGDSGSGASPDSPLPSGASEICDRYISCIAATAPGALEQINAQYGAQGGCWDDPELAEACTRGCETALAELAGAYPESCWMPADACEYEMDCTASPNGPYCSQGLCGSDPSRSLGCYVSLFQQVVAGFHACDTLTVECAVEYCSTTYEAVFGPGAPCAGGDVCCGLQYSQGEVTISSEACMPAACVPGGESDPTGWFWMCLSNSCCNGGRM